MTNPTKPAAENRLGAAEAGTALANELCLLSPEFKAMWHDNDVRTYGEGTKQIKHPTAGLLSLEYSSFSVGGRADLSVVIYPPATDVDGRKVRSWSSARL